MRISFLSHEFPPIGGGASSALDALTKGLARRRHQVQILTIGLGNRETEENDQLGRSVLRFGVGRKDKISPSAWELLRSYLALRYSSLRPLRRFSPDVIVAFFAFPAGLAALGVGRRLDRRVVASLRGSDVPGFSDERWGILRFAHRFLVRPVLRRADLLTANGQFLTELAALFEPRRRIISLPNGVDTDRYHPPPQRRNDESLKVLFVGQLIERKRCRALIDTMRFLGRQGIAAELTLVGDGPLRSDLESASRHLPNGIRVTLTGFISRKEMPEVYRAHEVLVQPSKAEGISNVVLEGLASGLCVVGSRAAVGELLDHEESGIILDDVEPQNVGRALRLLSERPEVRRRMQLASRRIAENRSWDSAVESLERSLSRLLGIDAS